MKKNFRKNLIAVASIACMATLAFSVGTNVAKADSLSTTNNFYMTDGAAIRVKSGAPSGIRWSVTVTESYYNRVTSLGEVQWGMVVDNVGIEEKGASATQVDIPLKNQKLPEFDADDGVEEKWTYYASITYDELVADMKEAGYSDDQIEIKLTQAYETVLYARAYNIVNDVTTLAVDADTGRAIKGVAMHCLIENTSDVTADNKSTFVSYAGGEYATVKTESVTKNAYDLTNATGTVTSQDELAAGDYTVYVGAKKISDKVTHNGGTISVTIAGLGSTIAVKGEENNVRFINADGEVYQVPFVSATHAISTKDELTTFLNSYNKATDGTNPADNYYAVLLQDIDFDNAIAMSNRTYNNAIFTGTFDGMGYAIKNYAISNTGGLFGAIFGNALIKDVAFINAVGGAQNAPLVLGQTYGGKVQNVYVKGSYVDRNGYRGMFYAGGLGVASNCIVDIDYPADATATTNVFTGGNSGGLNAANMYGIGNATQLEPQTATAPYATVAAMLAVNKGNIVSANGWSEYWSVGSYGLFFGDEKVAD